MYKLFEKWLNSILVENTFEGVKAFNFNLYEDYDENNTVFMVQLIGAPSYDSDNSDWACEEIFSTGENLFQIPNCNDWEVCLQIFEEAIKRFITDGKNANVLLKSEAVTYGFVDGDLEIAYQAGDKTGDGSKSLKKSE